MGLWGLLALPGEAANWALVGVEIVDYRQPMPARQIALWAIPLVTWFILMLFLSVAVLDERIADGLFAWYPESVRDFASVEGDGTYATWVMVVVSAVAVAINGIVGPEVEELLPPRLSLAGNRPLQTRRPRPQRRALPVTF